MKLYYAPGACSLGIHVLLEEIGKPYDGVVVNLRQGEQFQPGFTAVNPKSKVPTLERDESRRAPAARGRRKPGSRAGGAGLRRRNGAHAGRLAVVPPVELHAEPGG